MVAAVGVNLVFPRLSDAVRRGEPAGPVLRRSQAAVGAFAGWLVTGAVCVGPTFVLLFYDDRYAAAAGYIETRVAAPMATELARTLRRVTVVAEDMALSCFGPGARHGPTVYRVSSEFRSCFKRPIFGDCC